MCASLAEVSPMQLVRRLVVPLFAGVLAMLAASLLLSG
jgi:C4-dicarboxylate transporter